MPKFGLLQQVTVASMRRQASAVAPLMACIYGPIVLGLAALLVIYLKTGIPLRVFFTDPVSEFNAPMYVGFVSNIGVLLWGAGAAVCLFGGWLLFQSETHRDRSWFLLCAGLVSTMLMLDDLFLLHEEAIEDHLFIPQQFVIAAYGAIVLGFIYGFRNTILRTDFIILVIAFVFLGASVGVDLLVKPEEFYIFGNIPGRDIVEDGLKLFGIASWATYFVRTAAQEVINGRGETGAGGRI